MSNQEQQLIHFQFDKSYKTEDFFVSKCNFFAYSLLNSWPKWEKNIINIHGEDSIFDFWFKTQNGKLFEENFLDVYGKDYKTYVDEFEDFIRNSSKSEIMSILPSS